MHLIIENNISDIKKKIQKFKTQNKSIGFVPTMGSLHKGHISLVNESCDNNNITIVSIFVNPTQFNDKNDLDKYPRNIDNDLEKLSQTNCDIVFIPSETDMYPEPDNRIFNFGYIETVMEGRHRKGHFNGVAQIVSKLFNIVEPNNAYFGLKDYQQYMIIKDLVKQLNLDINIVPCDTFREKDGLAMSSRNALLSSEQRENAPFIYEILNKSIEFSRGKEIADTKKWVCETINSNSFLKVEYFEIINGSTLSTVTQRDETWDIRGCIAVKMNNIRLIDNIKYNL